MRQAVEMLDEENDQRLKVAVWALLGLQLLLLWLSIDAVLAISVFCTGTKSLPLNLFSLLHFAYAALLLLGVASLLLRAARKPYAIGIVVTLAALPLQYWFVGLGYLYCDGP